MKIGEVVKGGFSYGLFTAIAMAVPVAIVGSVYGVVTVIHKVKEHRER